MKAQIISCPPPPREVVVTMGEDEAKLLFRTLRFSPLIPGALLTLHDALYHAGIREYVSGDLRGHAQDWQ